MKLEGMGFFCIFLKIFERYIMEYLDVLKRCQIFRNVSQENISEIIKASEGKIKYFTDKQLVSRRGTALRDIGIVLNGKISGTRGTITKGGFFGIEEAAAEIAAEGDIYSEGEAEVLFINFKKLIKCSSMGYSFFYRVMENMVGIISKDNVIHKQRLGILSKSTLRNKLLEYFRLQRQIHGDSSFSLNMSRSELADYLCVDRCSLSRELTKLQKDGFVEIDKQRILLKHKRI